jgi:hypothetical protein
MPEDQRSYLCELGVKTVLIIPLTSRGQVNGRLTFRFTEERDFNPEELEIARALATQASLAIQLTRLAKTARQSAVLERSNIPGSLRCNFSSRGVPEENCRPQPGKNSYELLRRQSATRFAMLSRRSSALRSDGSHQTLFLRSQTMAPASLIRNWPAGVVSDFPICGPG